ncbi:hypothetical protein AALP_AA7G177200 [Arabis alpina]|nr:hypothetical protein AALP_AA7G177200 [Arabis alpina]
MSVDNVVDFCWSPTDSILVLFVAEQSDGNQPAKVTLVQLPSKTELRQKNLFNTAQQHTGRVTKLVTLKGKQANSLFWSPNGKHIILADCSNGFNGKLEFYNVDELMTMATVENFMATDIKWDPTGSLLGVQYQRLCCRTKRKKSYEKEDDDVSVLLSKQEKEKRRMMMEEWEKWLNKWKMLREEESFGEDEEEEEECDYYETNEEFIDVSEEVVAF